MSSEEEYSDAEDGSPKPLSYPRNPDFEVIIDPMDEPWEWPAKLPEVDSNAGSDDDEDGLDGRSTAGSEEVVYVLFCFLLSSFIHAQCIVDGLSIVPLVSSCVRSSTFLYPEFFVLGWFLGCYFRYIDIRFRRYLCRALIQLQLDFVEFRENSAEAVAFCSQYFRLFTLLARVISP